MTTALILVDLQNGVLANVVSKDKVLKNIASLIKKARSANIPILWIQHSDDMLLERTEEWQLVSTLDIRGYDIIVHKHYGDAFEDTELAITLHKLGVDTIYVAGAQSDACVRSTIHGGFTRGFNVTLVSDAHTTQNRGEIKAQDIIDLTNIYWSYQTAPGRQAQVLKAKEIKF